LVSGARGRTKTDGVLEEGPEEDNVSLKREEVTGLEKAAL
jgi:hypothetical protein